MARQSTPFLDSLPVSPLVSLRFLSPSRRDVPPKMLTTDATADALLVVLRFRRAFCTPGSPLLHSLLINNAPEGVGDVATR